MPTFEEFKNILALGYILPTFILYFIILYTIFFSSSRKKFLGSFYWIFGFSAINYIIHTISYYIVYRMNTTPFLVQWQENWPKEHFLYPIIYIICYGTAHANAIWSVLLCFNRCTVFLLKAQYKIFWQKYLKFFLAFCIIFPFILVWHMPFIGINKALNILGAFWIAKSVKFVDWWDPFQNLYIEILITSLLSAIMNIYVVVMLIKLRASKNNGVKQISAHDRSMMFFCMIVFSTELASAMQQCMLKVGYWLFVDFVYATQYILADLITLAPAWAIFVMNKELRKEALNLMLGNNHTAVVSITITSSTRS